MQYFSYLETAYSKPGIGDKWEGKAVTLGRTLDIGSGATPEEVQELSAFGIDILEGATGLFSVNERVSLCPHALIFSYSEGNLQDLWPVMAQAGYNACVEILAPEKLANSVGCATVDSHALRLSFPHVDEGHVKYEAVQKSYSPFEGVLTASPFRKQQSFAEQCERRVVIWPQDQRHKDIVQVQLDDPDLVFGNIHHCPTEVSACPPGLPSVSRDELLVVIATLMRIIDERRAWSSHSYSVVSPMPDQAPRTPEEKSLYFSAIKALAKDEEEHNAALLLSLFPIAQRCYWQARIQFVRAMDDDIWLEAFGAAMPMYGFRKALWSLGHALVNTIEPWGFLRNSRR